jgi:hypothetical protein
MFCPLNPLIVPCKRFRFSSDLFKLLANLLELVFIDFISRLKFASLKDNEILRSRTVTKDFTSFGSC